MFWDNFVKICNKNGVKPNKVCSDLGFSSGTATWWRKGRKPRDTALQKIAGYFGVSVGYLLGEPEDLEDVDIAFYGQYRELTEEQKNAVRQMVRLMRQKG